MLGIRGGDLPVTCRADCFSDLWTTREQEEPGEAPDAAEAAGDEAAAHPAPAQASADCAATRETAEQRAAAASARPCRRVMHRRSSLAWRASLVPVAKTAISDTCSPSAGARDRHITCLACLQACVNSPILACMLSGRLLAVVLYRPTSHC